VMPGPADADRAQHGVNVPFAGGDELRLGPGARPTSRSASSRSSSEAPSLVIAVRIASSTAARPPPVSRRTRGCDPLLPGRAGPISGTRSISCAASAVRTAGAGASTLHSALRIAEANGVTSARDTAIAAISAGVKLSGGRGSVLSTT